MNEKILKSIGFPLKMLVVIDKYAHDEGMSRSDVVRIACDEFIKKHDLELEK